MARCHLALGGNVGGVASAFDAALSALDRHPGLRVARVSPIVRTRPVGEHAGGEFANAAAALDTSLDPLPLLELFKDLERRAGRSTGRPWGPRPLDLDLIFYDDAIIETPVLSVPHPACWYRRFVLDPLAEIAGDVRHPVKGLTVSELRERLLPRPLRLALAGSPAAARRRLAAELGSLDSASFEVVDWTAQSARADPGPAIIAWLGPSRPGDSPQLEFAALPVVPRLDASHAVDSRAFLRGVLASALG